MIELNNNELAFSFPEVHKKAQCKINFQRTLRIPDDNQEYPLPAGMGKFPIEHVDDYAGSVPSQWVTHGGVFLPMYQSEALWVSFPSYYFEKSYPCAIKVAAGKINAVTGKSWSNSLSVEPQDYVVTPEQPWLDGFNVDKGYVRQFVAMPLGAGFSAEEQITGEAEYGGMQIIVYPMKGDVYYDLFERRHQEGTYFETRITDYNVHEGPLFSRSDRPDMGLAPGGLMRQEIYEDEHGLDVWDQDHGLRCFIHLCNSESYRAITGHKPPHKPITAKEYEWEGIPWFDYYSDGKALEGSVGLGNLASVAAKMIGKGHGPMQDNESMQPREVKSLGLNSVVRDGDF